MPKPRVLIAALCLVAAIEAPSWSRDDFASPSYAVDGAAYLRMPSHAHATALGNAVTAWQGSVAGLQYNPAILDAVQRYTLIASYSFLSDDRLNRAADLVIPAGEYLVAGFSVVYAGVDKIERRGEDGMLDIARPLFTDREMAIAASVSGRLLWNIAVAARARYLSQTLADQSANGMGLDLGATWTPDSMVCVGMSGLNIGSYLWWKGGTRNAVASQARLGVALRLLNKALIIEMDGAKRVNEPIDGSLGVEYTLYKVLSIRAGILSSARFNPWSWRDPVISTGLGIRYSFFGFDYGLSMPTGNTDLMVHRVSLLLFVKSQS
jgi:hypothetical protein